jgi:hypothetical protein
MSKKLEIQFEWERRINDHAIPSYSLYVNGLKVYSARYYSCVVRHINEKYATRKNSSLSKKLKKLSDKHQKLGREIYEIQRVLSEPLLKIEGTK